MGYRIFALRVSPAWAQRISTSLKAGEGRFGWSYIESADLTKLRGRAWQALNADERDCYQEFLLDIRPDDYVVYVNVPSWGQCTLAQVNKPYFFRWEDEDFNHRFGVDPASVKQFERHNSLVPADLRARLGLMGRWWRIYTVDSFKQLLVNLDSGAAGKTPGPKDHLQELVAAMRGLLPQITSQIHKTHPNHSLEWLIAAVMKHVPGVVHVEHRGGPADHGADLVVTFEDGLPGLRRQRRCVVQVKSYEGAHEDVKAVDDIRRAFAHYQDADCGLIISSARESSEALEEALKKLRSDSGKEVGLLIGGDVASFILQYGAKLIV